MPVNNWIPVAQNFVEFLDKSTQRRKKLQNELTAMQMPQYINQQLEGLTNELDILKAIPQISANLYKMGPEVGQFGAQILGNAADLKMKGITYQKDQKSKQEFLIGMYQQYKDRPLNIAGQVTSFGKYFEDNKLEILANPDLYSKTIPTLLSESLLEKQSYIDKAPDGKGYLSMEGYKDKSGEMIGPGVTHNIYSYKAGGKTGYYKETDQKEGYTEGDKLLSPKEFEMLSKVKQDDEMMRLRKQAQNESYKLQRRDVQRPDGKAFAALYDPQSGLLLDFQTKKPLDKQEELISYSAWGAGQNQDRKNAVDYTYEAGSTLKQNPNFKKIGEGLNDADQEAVNIAYGNIIGQETAQAQPGVVNFLIEKITKLKTRNDEQKKLLRELLLLNSKYYQEGGATVPAVIVDEGLDKYGLTKPKK